MGGLTIGNLIVCTWVMIAGVIADLTLHWVDDEMREMMYGDQFKIVPRWIKFGVMWATIFFITLSWPGILIWRLRK